MTPASSLASADLLYRPGIGGRVFHRAHHIEALQPQQRLLAGFFLVGCHLLRHQLLKGGGGGLAQLQAFSQGPGQQVFITGHAGRSGGWYLSNVVGALGGTPLAACKGRRLPSGLGPLKPSAF
jgi:hypothetical protein